MMAAGILLALATFTYKTAGYLLRPRPQALVSFYGYGDIAGEGTMAPGGSGL
jgi:hypothetical protein